MTDPLLEFADDTEDLRERGRLPKEHFTAHSVIVRTPFSQLVFKRYQSKRFRP